MELWTELMQGSQFNHLCNFTGGIDDFETSVEKLNLDLNFRYNLSFSRKKLNTLVEVEEE